MTNLAFDFMSIRRNTFSFSYKK